MGNTWDAAAIERLVRTVVAQLDGEQAVAAAPIASQGATEQAEQAVFAGSVVALADLRGRLAGVREAAVSPRAIVTPAARELLHDRKIKLVRAESKDAVAAPRYSSAAGKRLALAIADGRPGDRAVEMLRREFELRTTPSAGWAAAVAASSDAVRDGWRCLLLSEAPARDAAEVNRSRGVWAAAVQHAGDVRRIRGEMSLNIAAIDPRGASDFALLATARALCAT